MIVYATKIALLFMIAYATVCLSQSLVCLRMLGLFLFKLEFGQLSEIVEVDLFASNESSTCSKTNKESLKCL